MLETKVGPSESKKWMVAIGFAMAFGIACGLFIDTVYGTYGTFSFWSSWLAATAGLLLATSFSASSVSYFYGWPDMKKGYQKQIGILAFWLCFVYCITLLLLEPQVYYYGFFDNLATPNFILGLGAMTIFALMVIMNSAFVAPHVSWQTIRLFLNLGFLGYAFLVMRAIFLEWPIWVEWTITLAGVPTNRFILSIIAIGVLFLRLFVIIHREFFVQPQKIARSK